MDFSCNLHGDAVVEHSLADASALCVNFQVRPLDASGTNFQVRPLDASPRTLLTQLQINEPFPPLLIVLDHCGISPVSINLKLGLAEQSWFRVCPLAAHFDMGAFLATT